VYILPQKRVNQVVVAMLVCSASLGTCGPVELLKSNDFMQKPAMVNTFLADYQDNHTTGLKETD